jgi:hypothetical protein
MSEWAEDVTRSSAASIFHPVTLNQPTKLVEEDQANKVMAFAFRCSGNSSPELKILHDGRHVQVTKVPGDAVSAYVDMINKYPEKCRMEVHIVSNVVDNQIIGVSVGPLLFGPHALSYVSGAWPPDLSTPLYVDKERGVFYQNENALKMLNKFVAKFMNGGCDGFGVELSPPFHPSFVHDAIDANTYGIAHKFAKTAFNNMQVYFNVLKMCVSPEMHQDLMQRLNIAVFDHPVDPDKNISYDELIGPHMWTFMDTAWEWKRRVDNDQSNADRSAASFHIKKRKLPEIIEQAKCDRREYVEAKRKKAEERARHKDYKPAVGDVVIVDHGYGKFQARVLCVEKEKVVVADEAREDALSWALISEIVPKE